MLYIQNTYVHTTYYVYQMPTLCTEHLPTVCIEHPLCARLF